MGRKSKLDDELQKKIIRYISQGNTYDRACKLVGISERVFYYWKEAGEKAKSGKYFHFLQEVKKAEAKFIAYHTANITQHSQQNWQASAWLLERKCPKEFGKKVDLTSGDQPLVGFKVTMANSDGKEEIEL